jgi:hypothetical protein
MVSSFLSSKSAHALICIPVRLLLAYIFPLVLPIALAPYIGGTFLGVSLGFMGHLIFLDGKNNIFGQEAHWNGWRITHALLYLTAAVLALAPNERMRKHVRLQFGYASGILLLDAAVSVGATAIHNDT